MCRCDGGDELKFLILGGVKLDFSIDLGMAKRLRAEAEVQNYGVWLLSSDFSPSFLLFLFIFFGNLASCQDGGVGHLDAYSAHYLSILNRSLRVDIHTTEHLHVDIAIKHFHKPIVRCCQIRL